MSGMPLPTEETRLLQATHNQSDTIFTAEEPSTWRDTAKHVAKLVGWLLLSIPLVTIPCWTKSHIVEHWNAIFSSPDQGLPAAMYSEEHRHPELHLHRPLEKGEALSLEDGFFEVDSGRLPDSLVRSGEQLKVASAVGNIQGRSYTEKGTVYAYMDFLEQKYGERAIFIKELVDPSRKPNIFESRIIPEVVRAVKEGKQFVFIPVVQESSKDHIVLFTLNLASGAVEYFDPKGNAPSSKKICALPEMSLGQFRSELSRVLLGSVSRRLGEEGNPDLVELRDLLAQTDNDDLQTILQDREHNFSGAYSKLTAKIVERNTLLFMGYQEEWHHRPPPIGYIVQTLFGYKGSSIPELRKLVAACEQKDISGVQRALDRVSDSSFPKPIRDQIRNKYSRDFSVESLKIDAQKELQRMESFQRRLLSEVDAEILKRGAKSNPYNTGTYNYSYGSKTPHQGKNDWRNCGRFVMHFMKMRLEQSLMPKGEEVSPQTQESRAFQAAAAAVKKPSEIRRELTLDLTT